MDKTKMDNVRITNILNKKANFKEGLMSYKTYFLNHVVRVEKIEGNNMLKFNRTKFNRMISNKEQDIYTNKLKERIFKYRAYGVDGAFIDINKFLYLGFLSLNNGLNLNLNEEV